MSDPDTTEKLVRTDQGFRLEVECTRGTGTHDQDKVKAELRTEELPGFSTWDEISGRVQSMMAEQRTFQPDEEEDE